MQRTRQIIAVTLVATALCADRLATAAPALRPEVGQMARQLASRLTVVFARTVPGLRIHQPRQDGSAVEPNRSCTSMAAVFLPHPADFSELHFRRPPPA